MSRLKKWAHGLVALSLFAQHSAFAQSQKVVERPPQFVLLAFDGSYNIDFWKESREFAKDMSAQGKDVKFTYFVSGVYWVHEKNYPLYMPPHKEVQFATEQDRQAEVQRRMIEANNKSLSDAQRRSRRGQYSDIGFGGSPVDVSQRIDQVNLAYMEGHEIASHGNGHYKGGSRDADSRKWNLTQWKSEFRQFLELIFNAFDNNKISKDSRYSTGYAFGPEDIVGFRAPTLDTNPAMFQALAEFNMKYDTSGANSGAEKATRWPSKNQYGTWMFPLGYISVAGTNKSTASMDYNFFVVQSKGVEDKANMAFYRDQMTQSYRKYFNDNYYGNRAPVHIGHHFSRWNGGAYWESMKQIASEVCGMPEVKCVTYTEYMNWLNQQGESQVASYRVGSFSKVSRPASLKADVVVGKTTVSLAREGSVLKGQFKMDRLATMLKYSPALKVNNVVVAGKEIDLRTLRQTGLKGSDVVVSAVVLNNQGQEVDSYSLKIEGLGTSEESISKKSIEASASLGDMPEAHTHDEAHE